jgi:CheY-like chemotaxis protein
MQSRLRILLLEDNVADVELIARELEGSGFVFHLEPVRSESDLRRALEAGTPDIILSDHGLPSLNGFKALEMVRAAHPELPFIFVSGSNDPGMVAKMSEEGATDYVFKRDIGDLKAAMLRALAPKPAEAPEIGMKSRSAGFAHAVVAPKRGRFFFCPGCRRIRDDVSRVVEIGNCCDTHAEVLVLRRFCSECDTPHGVN